MLPEISMSLCCAVLAVISPFLYFTSDFWIKLYIQLIVWKAIKGSKHKGLLEDREIPYASLNDSKRDKYDELSYLCVNAKDGYSFHVSIARKVDRKAYVMFTLDLNGVTYALPIQGVTYNNPSHSFSSSGLTIRVLDEGSRWRLSYSGPLRILGQDKPVEVKLLLLWKVHTSLLDAATNSHTIQSMTELLLRCYVNHGVSLRDIARNVREFTESSDRTTIQAGAFQGYIKVGREEERYLTVRGFKRHSYGELSDKVESVSSMEHLMVSEKGHYQYIRVPMYHGQATPDLSKVCAVKMYPNGELSFAGLKYVYPHLERVRTAVEGHSTTEQLNSYQLTDSLQTDRNCVLYQFSFQLKHPRITILDNGKGLLLFNNLKVVERDESQWQCLTYKDIAPYKASLSRSLLATVDVKLPAAEASLLVSLDHPSCRNRSLVGGKGSQLAVLYQADLQQSCHVPTAACLTTEALHLQLQSYPVLMELCSQLESNVHADVEKLKDLCEQLGQEMMSCEVNQRTSEAIRGLLKGGTDAAMFSEQHRLAVRSSAIGEDGEEQSAAGQMDTILGVKGYSEVLQAVLKCWASYFSVIAVQYRRQHGQSLNTGMGVVIQEMVHADQAGVLFTRDPVSGSCGTMVLNANHGVGESVVSGESEPDTFYVTYDCGSSDGQQLSINERRVGSKQVQYIVSDTGELTKQCCDVSTELCISDHMVLLLCEIGMQLEQGFGQPCDIEWAISDGYVYLLQSRPITTLNLESEYELIHEFDSPLVMDHEMLSTMNIGEALPEAVCPLTVSAILPRMESGLQKYVSVLGLNCSAKAMIIIKSCCNRIFMNVHSLEAHKGRSLIANRRMMELALAGHIIDKMTDDEVESYHYTVPLYRRIYTGCHFLYSLWTGLDRCLANEKDVVSCVLPQTTDCMLLMSHIERALDIMEQVFTDDMPATSLSAVYSQIIMGILTKGSEVWESKHFGDLASLLGCHLSEVVTVGVPEKLEELSRMVSDIPTLREKFCEVSPDEGHDLLVSNNTDSFVREAYINFMDKFGHRGIAELDVMRQSWSQNPAVLIETLQLIVRNPSTNRETQSSTPHIDEIINNLQSPLTEGEKRGIRFLLPRTKNAVNNREVCKSLLVKSAHNVKLAYWRLSELMHTQGYIPFPELLFFLTHSEVYDVLRYRNGALVNRAKRRSCVFTKQKAMKFARFSDGTPVPLVRDQKEAEVEVELLGMPVSIGEVTGIARVIKSLSQAHIIRKNDVMIVQYTDIGWAPFFPLISGLVTELGGLVSHGAVVAREYGIPCVASCSSATDVFNSGDLVSINGTTGVVKRLKPDADGPL